LSFFSLFSFFDLTGDGGSGIDEGSAASGSVTFTFLVVRLRDFRCEELAEST
jgi:hypothetical protein